MPCADVAAQHERRGAIRPALEDVWTTSFLANSVQVQALDEFEYVVLVCRVAQTNLQPFWLRLTGRRVVADYSKFARQIGYLLDGNILALTPGQWERAS